MGKQTIKIKDMITTAIVWDHRNRTKKGEKGPLEVRVTVERKPYYINTGVRVYKSEWKYDQVVDCPECRELTHRIDVIRRKVAEEVNRCIENNVPIDVSDIKRKVVSVTDSLNKKATFLDWCTEQVPLMSVSDGRRKHYDVTLARLYEFGQMRTWEDVTIANIYAWDAWLHKIEIPATKAEQETGINTKPLGQSTIYNQHKNLKKLLHLAFEMGVIDACPYDRLKGKFERGEKDNIEYLDEDEIKKVMEYSPLTTSRLAIARDLFIIQMYTGMAYADMQELKIEDYKKVAGKWIYNGERVKTGVMFVNQLLPPVVEVLKRHDWKVPLMVNQEYNRLLKDIGINLGIKTKLHSHLARHTFATMMLRNGVKVENLQKMMGHRKITQTMRYAKVMAESVHDDFDMISKKLKKQ